MAVSCGKATQRLEGFIELPFSFPQKIMCHDPTMSFAHCAAGEGCDGSGGREVSSKLSASKVNNTFNFTPAHMLTLRPELDSFVFH